MSKENTEQQTQKLRNVVVSVVITPEGDGLRADASVSVNGKPVEGVQVGLVLAGDISLAVTSGTESLQSMRAVATGAISLAEGLREQVFTALERGIAQALTPAETPSDIASESFAD
jgi:hypothetical protein